MTHCPNCNSQVSAFRLLWVTAWSPYRCSNCSSRFLRRTLHATLLGGIGAGLGALIIAPLLRYSIWVAVFACIGLLAVVALLDWLLVPLVQVEEHENSRLPNTSLER